MTPEREQALRTLVEVWLSHRPVDEWRSATPTEVTIRRAEVILRGRPGLLDLVAEVNGRLADLVVGLRRVGDEPHFLRSGDEIALGLLEDDDGLAVCTDAFRDARMRHSPSPLSAAWRRVRVRWPWCATTSTPPCSTVVIAATSGSSPG